MKDTVHARTTKGRPGCYAKSPTAQGMFRPILELISCVWVTRRWDCLFMHKALSDDYPTGRRYSNVVSHHTAVL